MAAEDVPVPAVDVEAGNDAAKAAAGKECPRQDKPPVPAPDIESEFEDEDDNCLLTTISILVIGILVGFALGLLCAKHASGAWAKCLHNAKLAKHAGFVPQAAQETTPLSEEKKEESPDPADPHKPPTPVAEAPAAAVDATDGSESGGTTKKVKIIHMHRLKVVEPLQDQNEDNASKDGNIVYAYGDTQMPFEFVDGSRKPTGIKMIILSTPEDDLRGVPKLIHNVTNDSDFEKPDEDPGTHTDFQVKFVVSNRLQKVSGVNIDKWWDEVETKAYTGQ